MHVSTEHSDHLAAAQTRTRAVAAEAAVLLDDTLATPSLDVPVFLVEGRYEAAGRETLARQWFDLLSAPSKRYVVFEHSGHNPPFDEPGRLADHGGRAPDHPRAPPVIAHGAAS